MIEKVKARLASLGYTETVDWYSINFAIVAAERCIKHFCNISEIPECLEHIWIDMSAGDFLLGKQSLGQLSSMQVEQVVKKIQDGDALVEYSSSVDPYVTLTSYLNKLVSGHEQELMKHRKLRW